MGPMPDRFLSYLIEGEREGLVLPPGAIAAHERAQALGCVAAVQLLAEGAPIAIDIAMRARRLLRVLERFGRDARPYAVLREPGLAGRFACATSATTTRCSRAARAGASGRTPTPWSMRSVHSVTT